MAGTNDAIMSCSSRQNRFSLNLRPDFRPQTRKTHIRRLITANVKTTEVNLVLASGATLLGFFFWRYVFSRKSFPRGFFPAGFFPARSFPRRAFPL